MVITLKVLVNPDGKVNGLLKIQMARSKELVPGVGRFSRSQVAAKRGLYKGLKKSEKPAVEPTPETVEKTIGGNNNGEKRIVPTSKAPRFYSAEDVRQPKKSRKTAKPPQLRSSITPGTVLILLAGRFRGKRVVFLKQLESGLLLVSGPYKVELEGIKLSEELNDAYFAKPSSKGAKSAEEEFFEEGKPKEKEAFPASKAALQKEVDSTLITAIKKTENLVKYLRSTWGLSKGQYPHQMAF
ncbi:60s ribosomal protein l6 [Lentinula edodes]|uniref:60s ribosomal protein l6 n=1 Tax=Lentinula edodes TaxID=5353 RepID=A0A1Q3DV87_LENED|nr:60s ribosomal protein l6 [Lentinula edodes]